MTSLTEKQQGWLEELVFKGQTTTKIKIVNDLITIELASMTGTTQLATEKAMTSVEGSSVYVLHTFAIQSLAQALLSYETKDAKFVFVDKVEGEKKITAAEQALEFIKSRPTTIIDAMIKAHSDFERELKQIVSPTAITENFTTTPGTEQGSSSTSKV